MIQKLLGEAVRGGIPSDLVSLDPGGVEAPADWKDLLSGENYLGYARTQNFASSVAPDKRSSSNRSGSVRNSDAISRACGWTSAWERAWRE
jgi:hypothetical protein